MVSLRDLLSFNGNRIRLRGKPMVSLRDLLSFNRGKIQARE